ncbi:MAG: alkaline phosphatase family protein [Solirubrobacterales bacterium]
MKKLVLAYVDSLRTDMLKRAIAEGRAPTFGRLVRRGVLVEDCVSSFPSVTPVASAEMVTGVAGDRHWISGMNWYHRVERRYVEYGSSLEASRAFGIFRSLHDLIYNMNLSHLNPGIETVFETLDDMEFRTAATPFLIYRGRHRHQVSLQGITGKVVESGIVGIDYGTWGPKELFYGDIYASMPVPCKPSSVPGRRDQYSACCAAEMVSRNRFDFMLLSFPDNDNYSHRHGPMASVTSIERADLCMADVIRAAGGMDGFLAEHALILLADHAHTDVEKPLEIIEGMARKFDVLQASEDRPGEAEVAVSPTSRAAHIYILKEQDNPVRHRVIREQAASIEGVELLSWLEYPDGTPFVRRTPGHGGARNLVVAVEREGRQLRFTRDDGTDSSHPATPSDWDTVEDRRGSRWLIRGDLEALEASVEVGRVETPVYPDALGRLYSAMLAPHSGDLMISATLGYECLDWGGAAHIGGGSHGSLRKEDSEGPLLFVGCGPDSADERRQWALQDVAPIIRQHFARA